MVHPMEGRTHATWVAGLSPLQLSIYSIVAAFGTYFCMYAFRKPFTAATYEGTVLGGLGLKSIYVAAQVIGYTLSKFVGIRTISSMPRRRRAMALLVLVATAEAALVLFAITPPPWGALWLFVNGLPLGMVFGLVLAFLEGRRQSEALAAGLCASFILSSGVVKTVGQSLIVHRGVSEQWMPALTGLIFAAPFVVFVAMLNRIPPPTTADVEARAPRPTMEGADRRAFLRRHRTGVAGLVSIYVLLTVARSIRDDFSVEIWQDMGVSDKPSVFAATETMVMIGVLCINGLTVAIKANHRAFFGSLGLSLGGLLLLVASVVLYRLGALGPVTFMTLSGLGLYVPYVAFHTTVFERLIALLREKANIGFLMYLADAFGYLTYVAVMLLRGTLSRLPSHLGAYQAVGTAVAILSMAAIVAVALHFMRTVGPSRGARVGSVPRP